MKWVFVVAVVIICLLYSGAKIDAQTSPLESPVKPQGLENCPIACIENLECMGYPTCNRDCNANIAQKYISPVLINGICQFNWVRMDNWMGKYTLLKNEYNVYCLPEFQTCEGYK